MAEEPLSNLAPVFGLCFLFLLNVRNKTLDDASRRVFFGILALEVAELVIANIESALATLPYCTVERELCSVFGYVVRPLILMLFIFMLAPKRRTRPQNALLFGPLVVDLLAATSVFYTDIVYSFTDQNIFVRGPLGVLPILIVCVYMVILVVVMRQRPMRPHFDFSLTVFIVIYMAVSMGIETFLDVSNVGRTAMVYSTMFYFYLYQTGVLRRTLETEAEERARNESLVLAKREADRANAAKTNFLSRMSHDIRTPLNGIIGLLEINKAHADDIDLVTENQDKMRIAADHLLELINDVLEMSKLEDENIQLVHEPCDLREVSATISSIIQTKVAEEGQTLVMSKLDIPVRYVYTSPLHLRQVFLNIYGNCVKYNKDHGTITTSVECLLNTPERACYRWTISDTGIGMSPEYLEHIFEPFTQEAEGAGARTGYNGTGLGMSIVKRIVDRMGGTIEVSSVKGEGTTFVVTIPFDVAAPIKNIEKDAEPDSIQGLHVLVAEDNELNAEIVQTLLEDRGARVTIARDGAEAVQTFLDAEPQSFDVILMDIMMPNMSGLEATDAIRRSGRADALSVPIIAMTANAFAEDAQRCLAAGMNAHLPKPIDLDEVMHTIARCTEENS